MALSASGSERPWSLRDRLFLLTVLAIAGSWIAGGAAIYFALDEESSELFDERLKETSELVMSYADIEIDTRRQTGTPLVHFGPGASLGIRYQYQIWTDDRQLVLRSPNAPEEPIAPRDQRGFATRKVDGKTARTYVETSEDGDEVIMMAEPMDLRQTFVGTFHTRFFPLFIVTLPLLLIITWSIFRRATRALRQTAEQMIGRSPTDPRPIEVSSPPIELEAILTPTNELLARFAKALDSERRLTAAAAHELRTPLAAVRVQAQVAARARTPEELATALSNLGKCVDRASRMLDQLLTLAKLEAMQNAYATCAIVSLDSIAAGVLHDLTPLLKKHRIRVSTALEPAPIFGVEFGLAALVRNLIDNAARHSPRGSAVKIETGQDDKSTFVMVRDTGPGIPEEEREHVFERFYRLPGSTADGSGIGLSIVQTVLNIHHGRIHLCEAEQGGLCACVRFPKGVVPTTTVGPHPISDDGEIKHFLIKADDKALARGREPTHPNLTG